MTLHLPALGAEPTVLEEQADFIGVKIEGFSRVELCGFIHRVHGQLPTCRPHLRVQVVVRVDSR